MQRNDELREDGLIDLGPASTETKGGSFVAEDTDGPLRTPIGLCHD
jgi:hypothetical protein